MRALQQFIYYINKVINSYTLKRHRVSHGSFRIYGLIRIVNNGGRLVLGERFSANSGKKYNPIGGDTVLNLIVFRPSAVLIFGKNAGISNSTIVCWDRVEIGDNVVIGGGCRIWDTNFHSLDAQIRTSGNDQDIRTAPVKIGDNVFIGAGVIILKGVTIGENSIVAAGSVVNKDIPPNTIAAGNPCVVIKDRTIL
jgi:acetyltransferase-like isoleucine patch superfamily enzyme